MVLLRDQRLRVFHAVAVRKNFTEAGRDLSLTQQAISFHIRSLEEELNAPLFKRGHHSVGLTKAGIVLFAHADKILADYEEAMRSMAELQREGTRHLRIAATNSISKYTMPSAIKAFRVKHPGIQVVLEVGNSTRVMDHLVRGAVDVAITSDGTPLPSDYRVTPFFRDRISFIVSKQHPWAARTELSFDDMRSTTLIMREEGSGTRALFERHLRSQGLSLQLLEIGLVVGSPESVKAATEAGIGVGILSSLCLRHDPKSANLIQKQTKDFDIVRDFYVVRPPAGSATSAVSEFMSIARDAIAA